MPAGKVVAPQRWTWAEIEAALLAVPLTRWQAISKVGFTAEDGALWARAAVSDDLRRSLDQLNPPLPKPRD